MESWKPKINEECKMAIGSERHPPKDQGYGIGRVIEYDVIEFNELKIVWKNKLGCTNSFASHLCQFKKLTA